ncbi:hypothetical protein L218DRAFT_839995, partial [Marasmius fiardii PR-910]
LSPLETINLGKANRETHATVKHFYLSAFRVEKVLRPFFTDEEVSRFRQLQVAYKFLVSGSTALAFFTREVYDEADLDVYISPSTIMVLMLLLQSMGYTFVPIRNTRRSQASELEDAVEGMLVRMREGMITHALWQNDEDTNATEYSFAKELVDVFNFERDGRKIQVLAAVSPLAVVLSFHSTVVMNIISHSHAVSLYPRVTFCDRVGARNALRRTELPVETVEKYKKRGFDIVQRVDAVTALAGRYSAMRSSDFRRPGDRFCWTVPLEPVADVSGVDLIPDLLFEESWKIQY